LRTPCDSDQQIKISIFTNFLLSGNWGFSFLDWQVVHEKFPTPEAWITCMGMLKARPAITDEVLNFLKGVIKYLGT
jgi:hypothetical protein